MEARELGGLRAELELLEAQEALVSAKRRHLHNQLDFGYGSEQTRETTRAREHEISAERQEMHRRIEELRDLLNAHV
jgi:hypothetical protein